MTNQSDPYETKLHSLLDKMNPRTELKTLLDLGGNNRKVSATPKSDINTVLNTSKGVSLNSKGSMVKTGGRITNDPASMKYMENLK